MLNMGITGGTDSSSGEEDGDAEWKAAIYSVTAVDVSSSNGLTKFHASSSNGGSLWGGRLNNDDENKRKTPGIKLYQIKDRKEGKRDRRLTGAGEEEGETTEKPSGSEEIQSIQYPRRRRRLRGRVQRRGKERGKSNQLDFAQKQLDDLLDKNIEMVLTHIPANDNHQSDGGVIRLFKKAPPGMRLNPIDQDPGPQKKPKIIPGEEIDEKSKQFRSCIQSVAISGSDILAAARQACQRSLAGWESRDTASKAAAKHEEERIAELKRARGEKWLPSVAREMKSDTD